jgi:hypothetical protein
VALQKALEKRIAAADRFRKLQIQNANNLYDYEIAESKAVYEVQFGTRAVTSAIMVYCYIVLIYFYSCNLLLYVCMLVYLSVWLAGCSELSKMQRSESPVRRWQRISSN